MWATVVKPLIFRGLFSNMWGSSPINLVTKKMAVGEFVLITTRSIIFSLHFIMFNLLFVPVCVWGCDFLCFMSALAFICMCSWYRYCWMPLRRIRPRCCDAFPQCVEVVMCQLAGKVLCHQHFGLRFICVGIQRRCRSWHLNENTLQTVIVIFVPCAVQTDYLLLKWMERYVVFGCPH